MAGGRVAPILVAAHSHPQSSGRRGPRRYPSGTRPCWSSPFQCERSKSGGLFEQHPESGVGVNLVRLLRLMLPDHRLNQHHHLTGRRARIERYRLNDIRQILTFVDALE